MKKIKSLSVLLVLSIALSVGIIAQAPIRVVCVGNSITWGFGLSNNAVQAWPVQLNNLLGNEYSVLNCGSSGRIMSRLAKYYATTSYWNTTSYTDAINNNPQILIISLGTNDADQGRWPDIKPTFKEDYIAMIDAFRNNGKNPIIYLVLPPPIFINLIQKENIENDVIPIIKQISVEKGAYVIDYNTSMTSQSLLFPDGIHPNSVGALKLAHLAYDSVSFHQVITPFISVNDAVAVQKDTVTLSVGDKLTFKPTPDVSGTWKWTGPNGFASTLPNPTISDIQLINGGTYIAEYTDEKGNRSIKNFMVSLFGCNAIVFNPYYQIGQNSWQNTTSVTINPGNILTFGPQVTGGTGDNWNWTGPNGFYNHSRQFSLNYIASSQVGNYTAIYYSTDGCKSTAVFTVKVEGVLTCPKLSPSIDYAGWKNITYAAVSANTSIKFGPQPVDGSWNWEGPANFKSVDRETFLNNIQLNNAGKYLGIYTNDAGCKDTLIFTIAVNCPTLVAKINYKKVTSTTLTPSVFVNDTIVLTPLPITGNWSWTGPNAFTSTTQKDSVKMVQLTQAGKYKAVYTDANFCLDSVTYTLTVKAATGIEVFEENGNSKFIPYPNPASDHIIIPGIKASTVITLLNSSGQIVKTTKSSVIGEYMFYIQDLKPGIYYVKSSSDTGKTYKFIKQ